MLKMLPNPLKLKPVSLREAIANGVTRTEVERLLKHEIIERVSINALKTALRRKMTTSGRISEVAKKLGGLKKLTPYLMGAA